MWMYLDNGGDAQNPREHTIDVKPGRVRWVRRLLFAVLLPIFAVAYGEEIKPCVQ